MHIGDFFSSFRNFYRHEREQLETEREKVALFCSGVFGIVSLIVMGIFGVLVFLALPLFNATYLLLYGFSFVVFAGLTVTFRHIHAHNKQHYLFPVYIFVLYLYTFGILVSINSVSGSHAATSIICLQVIFPLLIFDRSYRVNALSITVYIVHTLLSYRAKEYADFVLDLTNGGAFTLVGIIIGEYERSVKLSNFEKDRILNYQKSTDMLTELPNRRMLFERLNGVQEDNGSLAGLFMIDIDHFKTFNDTLGHQQGDTCLKTLGNCFAQFGKENGFEFYRYGGEEFCALTTTDTYEDLRKHAESLRKTVESLAIPFPASERGGVTISIGFAPHYYTQNYETTIKQADDALYNAKRTGRNCVFGSR